MGTTEHYPIQRSESDLSETHYSTQFDGVLSEQELAMEEEDDEAAEEEMLYCDDIDSSVLSGPAADHGSAPMQELLEDSRADLIGGSQGGGGGGTGGRSGAPGGPLGVPGFVSGRINVSDFQESCSSLLSAVKAELDDISFQDGDVDVSIDDLKIMTDSVLVEKALAEILEGQDSLLRSAIVPTGNPGHGEQSNEDAQADHLQLNSTFDARSEEVRESEEQEPQAVGSGSRKQEFNFSVPPKTGKKRGRPFDRDRRAAQLMDITDARRKESLTRMKKDRDDARERAPLHSLRAKKEREGLYARDQRPLRTLKFLNSILKTPKLASKEEFKPMNEGEVLLTVEIYDSMKRNLKTQEFIVCGSQPLTALKDRIYCLMDTIGEKAHVKLPSSYFLIEESFYNDMRHPKAIDYSLPIRKWVRENAEASEKWKALGGGGDTRKRRSLESSSTQESSLPPHFSAANMANVSFMDIECRLGAQFLYCHLGDCKHTVVIRYMRLVHPEDVQNAAAYTVLRYVHKLRHRKCTICCIYQASKVTFGDKLAPESPCFFCENCYFLLHYSKDGTILYSDFQVNDYYHE